ncbi:hypothetical protein [Carboxylicivirga sp. RSCT41]|uniref:hypothetical protein n=1 Tax=Carboxylicivirga agarovorans TaxID=3417570 RepID=UPI003D32C1A2
MKTKLLLLSVLLIISMRMFAQEDIVIDVKQEETKKVNFGIGVAYGFFNPKEINDLVDNAFPSEDMEYGFSELILNIVGKVNLNYNVSERFFITTYMEYAWAPKFMTDESSDETFYYSFNRFAPGLSPKVLFPFGSGKHSFFFSPGVSYNFMNFKFDDADFESTASNIGMKIQGGVNLQVGKVKMQPYMAYDYANSKDDKYDLELNYSGLQMGIDFFF